VGGRRQCISGLRQQFKQRRVRRALYKLDVKVNEKCKFNSSSTAAAAAFTASPRADPRRRGGRRVRLCACVCLRVNPVCETTFGGESYYRAEAVVAFNVF